MIKQYLSMLLTVVLLTSVAANAQALVIYPDRGQSQSKQESDEYACYKWAKNQTGYDPGYASSSSDGTVLRGGAKGAAGGALIGAIAGNAGKGAAIGAGVGLLGGGIKKHRRQSSEQDHQASYERAFSACMEGRGYTAK